MCHSTEYLFYLSLKDTQFLSCRANVHIKDQTDFKLSDHIFYSFIDPK